MVRKFYPEAAQLYERLTRMDPKNAAYFNKLGIAHHQNQNLRGARDAQRGDMGRLSLPTLVCGETM